MPIDGLSSVQSRISAIEQRIASLSNGGRPPVSVTEVSTNSALSSTSSQTTASTFAGSLASQLGTTATATSAAALAAGADEAPATSGPTNIPGTAEAFVEKLKSHLGVPYVWGGTDPETGLDCSGLVQVAAKEVGVSLPRVTWDQQNAGTEVASLAQARPGDLLITRGGAHVAVYLGEGKAIQAPRPGKTVSITNVANLGAIKTIRRVMPSASEITGTVTSASSAASTNLSGVLGLAGLSTSGMNTQQLARVSAATTELSGLGLMNSGTSSSSILGAGSLLGA